MAKYFYLQAGLRGAYLPDWSRVIRVETRKELRDIVESETRFIACDSQVYGFSKRAIARFVAVSWRNAGLYPFALPYRFPYQSEYSNAIFLSKATRDEFAQYEESE